MVSCCCTMCMQCFGILRAKSLTADGSFLLLFIVLLSVLLQTKASNRRLQRLKSNINT